MLIVGFLCITVAHISEAGVASDRIKSTFGTELYIIDSPFTYIIKNGIYKEDGKMRYYEKGAMHKGFKLINGKRYYFDNKGNMVTGLQEINGGLFYFNSRGVMKTGTFKVSTVRYKAKKTTGRIYSLDNLAEVICQMPQLPTGCDITAWTMMANYAGVEITKTEAADIMPINDNPNLGFGGSPYSNYGTTMVIYPGGLKNMTEEYLGSFDDMTGCQVEDIKAKLRNKRLVVVWLANVNGFPTHTVTLTGYDEEGFFYNNPWTSMKEKMSYTDFIEHWSEKEYRAMSY